MYFEVHILDNVWKALGLKSIDTWGGLSYIDYFILFYRIFYFQKWLFQKWQRGEGLLIGNSNMLFPCRVPDSQAKNI